MSLNLCFQAQCCLHTARSCFSMWNFSGRHTLMLDAHTGSCVICWNHLAFRGFAVSVRCTVWEHRAQTQSPWFRSDTYRCLWSFGQTGSCRIKHLIRWLKFMTDSKGSWARSLLPLRTFSKCNYYGMFDMIHGLHKMLQNSILKTHLAAVMLCTFWLRNRPDDADPNVKLTENYH